MKKNPSLGAALCVAATAACLAVFAPVPATAATYRLNDTASQVIPPGAKWDWLPGSLRTGTTTLEMRVRVIVRIETRDWIGKSGRIYMVLPIDGDAPVTAEWETQGRLLGGRLVSGERALVFTGPVPGPVLEDTMNVRLTVDSRLLRDDMRRLAFHFELDTP